MPVFFIRASDIQGTTITIVGPLFTHLSKSLRTRPGESLQFCDDQRHRHLVKIQRVTDHSIEGDVLSTQLGPASEQPRIILGQAVLKGEKMNWVIQKATELGVAEIVPLLTDRVVSRFNNHQSVNHQKRWQRIALEAAQQAERWDVPIIAHPQTASIFWERTSQSQLRLVLTERLSGQALTTIPFPPCWDQDLTLAVGPEGGWTEEEILDSQKAGAQQITLGDRILRAETASLTALCLAQARLGHLE